MSCGCMAGNDKCVRDECAFCCYCGVELTGGAFYNGVKHVEPPVNPRCTSSETGVHEALAFSAPIFSATQGFVIASSPSPVSTMIVNNIIAVRMCKLCGLVYWEPLPEKESP